VAYARMGVRQVSWSFMLPVLQVLALVVTFLLFLAKPESDKSKWRKMLFLQILFLFISVPAEIGKSLTEHKNSEAARQKESEQGNLLLQLLSEIESLNRMTVQILAKISESTKVLPRSGDVKQLV